MSELVPENSAKLKTACSAWDFNNPDLNADETIASMMQVMRAEQGMGLAANQIGLDHRLFVMEYEGNTWACFNPEIVSKSSEVAFIEEGCLSFPGLRLEIERPAEVSVKYQNSRGETCEEHLTGLVARCYQHELDHLNGIRFTDHPSRLRLKMALKRREKERRSR